MRSGDLDIDLWPRSPHRATTAARNLHAGPRVWTFYDDFLLLIHKHEGQTDEMQLVMQLVMWNKTVALEPRNNISYYLLVTVSCAHHVNYNTFQISKSETVSRNLNL